MSVYDLMEACIVRLVEQGGKSRIGTGFFIAPGYVLTCAHVVEPHGADAEQRPFTVESGRGTWQCMPEQLRRPDGNDLALIPVPERDHPCVLMGAAAEPFQPVWTKGFVSKQGEVRLEPTSADIEGERRSWLDIGGPEFTLLKFKGGQVVPGMSGAPLLNIRTSAVCGIVAKTRNEGSDIGGLAIPMRTILAGYPLLGNLQAAFHKANRGWSLSGLVMPDPSLTEGAKIEAIRTFPPGPGGILPVISPNIMELFFGLDAAQSNTLVQRANFLRTRVDQNLKPYLITLNIYQNVAFGPVEFWHAAFTQAAGRGPRMVAALLYEAPPGLLDSAAGQVEDLLSTLWTWPIN